MRSPLFRALSNDSISLAVDIEAIWTDHGSQLQMLGGFGAMAAQMAIMERTQDVAPEHQTRMRKAQQKVGEVLRRTIAGIYDELKVMDTMTVGIDLDNDGSFALTTDFIYEDALASRNMATNRASACDMRGPARKTSPHSKRPIVATRHVAQTG